jgi:DNA mismatch repair protein MutS2
MDARTFETLELESLRGLLLRHVLTPLGHAEVLTLRPQTDPVTIGRALDISAECAAYMATGNRFGLSGIEDPNDALARLNIADASLDARQILLVERLLAVATDLRGLFRDLELKSRFPNLASLTGSIPDLRRLQSEIHGKVLPGGEIDDAASPELRSIRRELGDARSRVQRTLESILRRETRAVQDEIITFRNGRFVIPVRTDSRGSIPGVVHGLSSSGQTTFVEPLTVIEQNNDLVRLREREELEIARILLHISDCLRTNLPLIRAAVLAIGDLDFAQAKGRLALEFDCVRPGITDGLEMKIEDGRHILLQFSLRQSKSEVVPVSMELDAGHRILVISGPNAGGKTVVLKTVGLMALMGQMGLLVPARSCKMPLFKQIFADIGDQQSIAANLSTFTAHLRNISEMTRCIDPPSLVLLDEVGTGTDPDEGTALAVAIVDYFRKAGATTVATTHYGGVKMWASRTPGVRNASVEFDEATLRPTYKLLLGTAGASSGLEIARRMNVPDEILLAARALIDPLKSQAGDYLKRLKTTADDQEAIKKSLEEERAAATAERAKLACEYERREEDRKNQFERELTRVIREFSDQSEKLIGTLKDKAAAEKIQKAAAIRTGELKRSAEQIKRAASVHGKSPGEALGPNFPAGARPSLLEPLREGDRVRILSLGREGTVDSIQENAYTVSIGALRYKTDVSDLQYLGSGLAAKPVSRIQASAADLDQPVTHEIKVIGLTADEALDAVDKFLDEAFLGGAEKVRIIHGHGKGILRKAIADFLRDHPHVASFELAPLNQGGAGATIAQLHV